MILKITGPEDLNEHVITWMSERHTRMGQTDQPKYRAKTPRHRGLSKEEVERLNELRPTHSLKELSAIFGRHPTTLAGYCWGKVDLRSVRSGRPATRPAFLAGQKRTA